MSCKQWGAKMTSKKRAGALASLAEEMYVQTNVRTDVEYSSVDRGTNTKSPKTKSRIVSNIPWYPKSEKLKKELKFLALHEDSSVTALIDEGIRMVLAKRGKDIKDYF